LGGDGLSGEGQGNDRSPIMNGSRSVEGLKAVGKDGGGGGWDGTCKTKGVCKGLVFTKCGNPFGKGRAIT